jgi:hypothetical protein
LGIYRHRNAVSEFDLSSAHHFITSIQAADDLYPARFTLASFDLTVLDDMAFVGVLD